MSVLVAIAAFPVLTLVLIGLSKAESGLNDPTSAVPAPAVPLPVVETTSD